MRLRSDSAPTYLALASLLGFGLQACGPTDSPQSEGPTFEMLTPELVEKAVALRQRALDGSGAYDFLADLTSEVGHRFAGSENDDRAVDWALVRLRELGFENVRAEAVTVPNWQRGEALGEIIGAAVRPLELVALGGSVGTPAGGTEAEVVEVASLEELAQLDPSDVAGRIVFLNRRMERTHDASGYNLTVPIRRDGPVYASRLGAVAVLIRSVGTSDRDVAHTGMTHYVEGVPMIPAAALSNPAADSLAARIGSGETVRFRLELGCRYLPDAVSANVIAEIPGRGRPEEIVLLVAHLDSWDLGAGALDDGAGVAIVTEAARLVGELDPRRTVRVWFAANEEFGISGGLAYDDRYAGETDRYVAAMEADFGAGRVWVMTSRFADDALPVARDLATLLEPLGIDYAGNYAIGGVDLLPLTRHHIPLIDLPQDGTYYFDAYHSAEDTFDKVDAGELAQAVAAYAVSALVAAEIEGGLGPAPAFQIQLPPPFDRVVDGGGATIIHP